MTVDLQMLILVAVLCVLQAFPYTLALIAKLGPIRAMSYPQPVDADLPEWGKRSKRAHLNLVENLAPFAVLVLAAHVIGAANGATALGATIFFWARLVQAIAHTLAIPFVRSLAWFTSLGGLIVILIQIV
jgi:uncharacterized MAPEG superfamily protein